MKLLVLTLSLVAVVSANNYNEAYKSSFQIKEINKKIEALREDLKTSTSWNNPNIFFGLNDISLKKPHNRNLEPMQTNNIGVSQQVPIGKFLSLKKKFLKIKLNILKEKKELIKNSIKSNIYKYLHNIFIEKRKLIILDKLIDNSSKMKRVSSILFNSGKIRQDKIVEIEINLAKFKIRKNNILSIINKNKTNLYKTFSKVDIEISTNLEIDNKKINIDKVIEHNPEIKISILQNKFMLNKSYQQLSSKQKFINTKLSYSHRQNFDDFLSLSVSMPIAIHKTEEIKAKKFELLSLQKSIKTSRLKFDIKLDLKNIIFQNKLLETNINLIQNNLIIKNKGLNKLHAIHLGSGMVEQLELYKNIEIGLKYKIQKLNMLNNYFNNNSKLIKYGVNL